MALHDVAFNEQSDVFISELNWGAGFSSSLCSHEPSRNSGKPVGEGRRSVVSSRKIVG